MLKTTDWQFPVASLVPSYKTLIDKIRLTGLHWLGYDWLRGRDETDWSCYHGVMAGIIPFYCYIYTSYSTVQHLYFTFTFRDWSYRDWSNKIFVKYEEQQVELGLEQISTQFLQWLDGYDAVRAVKCDDSSDPNRHRFCRLHGTEYAFILSSFSAVEEVDKLLSFLLTECEVRSLQWTKNLQLDHQIRLGGSKSLFLGRQVVYLGSRGWQ